MLAGALRAGPFVVNLLAPSLLSKDLFPTFNENLFDQLAFGVLESTLFLCGKGMSQALLFNPNE